MSTSRIRLHSRWTRQQWDEDPALTLAGPLLSLHRTSDVNDIDHEQIRDARAVLAARAGLGTARLTPGDGDAWRDIRTTQRRIVERFLAERARYYGDDQVLPFPEAQAMAAEGRDTFVVVKFMDEAPHLEATLDSLLHQDYDLSRLVLIAADNNSTDGSTRIVRDVARRGGSAARIIELSQPVPGAGHTARLGVDRAIATVLAMCDADGRWERLQTATVAVSDGDTVYHPGVLGEIRGKLDDHPDVDGVMPFLTYKLTAGLRLLHAGPEQVTLGQLRAADDQRPRGTVPHSLATVAAHDAFPRHGRRLQGATAVLTDHDGVVHEAPVRHDETVGRFAVFEDPDGKVAYLLPDRTLLLASAPVSGTDAALLALENGLVGADEAWKWHTAIGHDIFLRWAFLGMGLPEEIVFPDTSDALKTFRVWAFAIGGQHQLRRPGLRIATGSDYQSGRVLQAAGCTVVLGSAHAPAETEIDRLIKMVRNFVDEKAVFYGNTRSEMLERATGLYVHMTRIQPQLEAELRDYEDWVFRDVALPERLIFPLRWMFQNAVRYYCHGPAEEELVRRRFLAAILAPEEVEAVCRDLLDPEREALAEAPLHEKQRRAEAVAEAVIVAHYPRILAFYADTIRSFMRAHEVDASAYEWLLADVPELRNALRESPPQVDPTAVWSSADFDIDVARGQVTSVKGA
ncbi:glycosyltransferase family A protein [Myceligenerans indicum]|uniref:Glycosyltransferase family 2 protein n=1 Tax=Myceligenerans indicum TaxID=2593663 RepID=A0ABS1LHA1_9MICO|nr:glycosyltransferase family A protein [Myceligenerans indicum]MBL0885597.1 glycosyltransferase family 2 protein [Myceligenerans indicum]